jgi:hypothetical protein
MNPCKFVDQDEKENLRLDYQQTIEYIKLLTEIRFKLLVFTPVISGITIAFSEYLFKNNGITFIIGVLGFIATFGIVIYDQRNTQIYEKANSRAACLEKKLNFPKFTKKRPEGSSKQSDDLSDDCMSTSSKDNKYGGLFMDKPAADRKLLWRILACHDRGLALVYSASISGWSFLIVYSVLNILLNHGPILVPSDSYFALNQITNYIYSIVIAAAFGIIFFYNLKLLDQGCRNLAQELKELKDMLKKDLITKGEYEEKKQEILSRM